MRIVADTNVLVRAAALDDPAQAQVAADLLRRAGLIVVTVTTLCEFVSVMRRGYKWPPAAVREMIRSLVNSPRVKTDRPVIDAGMAMLEASGDFADGVIAFDGRRLGGTVFASFDREAVELIRNSGAEALCLGRASG